jgi:hypothetical protein
MHIIEIPIKFTLMALPTDLLEKTSSIESSPATHQWNDTCMPFSDRTSRSVARGNCGSKKKKPHLFAYQCRLPLDNNYKLSNSGMILCRQELTIPNEGFLMNQKPACST